MSDLRGLVALVTGGSRGIGAAASVALARAGASVVVGYHTDRASAETVVRTITGESLKAVSAQGDVGGLDGPRELVAAAVENFGRLDIAVNCAGLGIWRDFLEISAEEWDRQFAVNARGMFLVCQEAAREMMKQGKGKIINVTSITGQRADPELLAYSASKAAAEMLTRGLAVALGPHNITVNAVLPGTTATDMNRANLARPGVRSMLESRTPLGRLGAPDDMAGLIAFLASAEADYMNGACVVVDGGFLA
ncbi:MAG: glucose 1-dehydrogenase [Dehalococcoidia bacterium]